MKIIKVVVTQEDIATGRRHSCHFCPIALAFKRHLRFPYIDDIRVHGREIIYNLKTHLPLPLKAQNFIFDFDNSSDELPAPLKFEMELPEKGDWYYDVR